MSTELDIPAETDALALMPALMPTEALNDTEAGIAAVIQPGGSMRDDEVIAAANEHGMAMVFTGMRHFRH